MITDWVFTRAWKRLEDRWGKQAAGAAKDYREFLDPLMDDEEFHAAAKAVWATREFFPRPADFLAVKRDECWSSIKTIAQDAATLRRSLSGPEEDESPYHKRLKAWPERLRALPLAAQIAVDALGGVFTISDSSADTMRMRRDFFSAFEDAVSTIALRKPEPALTPGQRTPAITAGSAALPDEKHLWPTHDNGRRVT